MATKWLRKKQIAARYGEVSPRTVERMWKDGRLPPPQFPFRNKIPANTELELDEHDRAAVLAGRPKRVAVKKPDASDREANNPTTTQE